MKVEIDLLSYILTFYKYINIKYKHHLSNLVNFMPILISNTSLSTFFSAFNVSRNDTIN